MLLEAGGCRVAFPLSKPGPGRARYRAWTALRVWLHDALAGVAAAVVVGLLSIFAALRIATPLVPKRSFPGR